MKLASLDSAYLKALIYGAPGSQKTRTSYTATFDERFAPVLVLESAGNPLSTRDYNPRPTILTMEKLEDYSYPYDYILKGQPKDHPFAKVLRDAGVDVPDKYKTVIVDGSSETQRFAFRAVLPGADVEPGKVPSAYERQHFGRVLASMTNWGYKYFQLPVHVILTALEMEREDSGLMKKRPYYWGQSEGEMASYAYLVMRMAQTDYIDTRSKAVIAGDLEEAKRSQTVGFVRQSMSFYAKDQYGMRDEQGQLMKYMFNPTITKIWDAILAAQPEI